MAHAELQSTTPHAGATVAVAPTTIKLRFSEGIRLVVGGTRVLDTQAVHHESSPASASGSVLTVPVRRLTTGTYLVVWRVVSADGHPIRGTFTFQVGTGFNAAAVATLGKMGARELDGSLSKPSVAIGITFVRTLSFASLLVLLGAAGWYVYIRASWSRANRMMISAALWLQEVSVLILVVLDGPYANGQGFSAITSRVLLKGTLSSSTGRALLLRGVAATLLGVWLLGRRRFPGSRSDVGVSVVLGTLACLFVAQAGHASVERLAPLATVLDAIHVGAVGLWIGGVALVAMALRAQGGDLVVVQRFSALAGASVAAMVATGAFASWRQVGDVQALRTTTYGQLLMVKVALVAALVLLGGRHRRMLAAGATKLSSIRRGVAVEAVAAIVVLGLTAMISTTVPARTAVSKPVTVTVTGTTTRVDITVDPGRSGINEIHLYVFGRSGVPMKVTDVQATISNPATGVTLELRLRNAGPGHKQALGTRLPFAGTWQIQTRVYVTDFDVEEGTASFTLR